MPKNEPNKLIRVQIMLTPRLVSALDTLAQQATMSRSLLIRQACEQQIRSANREGRMDEQEVAA